MCLSLCLYGFYRARVCVHSLFDHRAQVIMFVAEDYPTTPTHPWREENFQEIVGLFEGK